MSGVHNANGNPTLSGPSLRAFLSSAEPSLRQVFIFFSSSSDASLEGLLSFSHNNYSALLSGFVVKNSAEEKRTLLCRNLRNDKRRNEVIGETILGSSFLITLQCQRLKGERASGGKATPFNSQIFIKSSSYSH